MVGIKKIFIVLDFWYVLEIILCKIYDVYLYSNIVYYIE